MEVVYPPNPFRVRQRPRRPHIFLAGTIEMGAAPRWQDHVARELRGYRGVLLNPRRPQWDSSWEQSIDCPEFKEQVEWELDALTQADLVLMYIHPSSKSPVTLMELGVLAGQAPSRSRFNFIICCPDGFWRKGNVDILCRRFGILQAQTLEGMISYTKEWLSPK